MSKEYELADGDYKAPHGLWVSCNGASIRIVPMDGGVSVSVYRDGHELDGTIAETWATVDELKED